MRTSTASGLVLFFSDYKSYLGALLYFGTSSLLSQPPGSFSILNCFAAARSRHALGFVLFPLCIALAGAGILLDVHEDVHLEYADVFLVTMGLFAALPMALCWYVMNLAGHFERAVGTGWMICFGNIGGIVAVFSFLADDVPRYHKGYSVVIFGLCLAAASAIAYAVGCHFENQSPSRTGGGVNLLL